MSDAERSQILGDIRRGYWHIRNLRGSYHVAQKRRHYRRMSKKTPAHGRRGQTGNAGFSSVLSSGMQGQKLPAMRGVIF
jgi:hypothetical protein